MRLYLAFGALYTQHDDDLLGLIQVIMFLPSVEVNKVVLCAEASAKLAPSWMGGSTVALLAESGGD